MTIRVVRASVYRLEGALTARTASRVAEAAATALAEERPLVILDLSRIRSITSEAAEALSDVAAELQRGGGGLTIGVPPKGFGTLFPRVAERIVVRQQAVDAVVHRVGPYVLLMHADADLRTLYSSIIRNAGFNVVETSSPASAQLVIERQPPLAIAVGGFSGGELESFLSALQEETICGGVPVVVVTTSPDTIAKPREQGSASYLQEPVNPADLVSLINELVTPRQRGRPRPTWDTQVAPRPYLRKILIVDDHDDNVELLRLRLESWGYRTESARDGLEAIQKIESSPPDLILLDVMMPNLDGIEVARRVKADPQLPFIPIIMQTALDATENKVEGLEAGADDYITKPIDFAELQARLRSMLRIKRLQEDLEDREQQLLAANERLQRIAQTDPLTGLINSRSFETQLQEMFEAAGRLGESVSCVVLDIDGFTSINESHGLHAGDRVLQELAALISESCREVDVVARPVGEDEFVVLLPGLGVEEAFAFAESLRDAVSSTEFRIAGHALRFTVSVGVCASEHAAVRSPRDLERFARHSLNRARDTGKNRVEVAVRSAAVR